MRNSTPGCCVLLCLLGCAWMASAQTNSTASANGNNSSGPNAIHSLLFLAIPITVCLTIITFVARRAYMGCSPKFGEKEDAATAKSSEDDEFCTSIDTTDSIDEITFADSTKTGGSGSWNPFKKYTNVAKTEASVPDEDVELGMKSKPIELGRVSKQEVQRSPHPQYGQHGQQGFARVAAYPTEGVMSVHSLGTVVRV